MLIFLKPYNPGFYFSIVYICKLATLVKGDLKAPFPIAT